MSKAILWGSLAFFYVPILACMKLLKLVAYTINGNVKRKNHSMKWGIFAKSAQFIEGVISRNGGRNEWVLLDDWVE